MRHYVYTCHYVHMCHGYHVLFCAKPVFAFLFGWCVILSSIYATHEAVMPV